MATLKASLTYLSWSSPLSLDRGAVDSLDPPQRGLVVTGKSSTPQKKSLVSNPVSSLAHFDYCFYFELFTLLELILHLVTLGCKPKLERVVP